MKFKLDENLSPSLLAMFVTAGHDAHPVVQQALGGQPDERVINVCRDEGRALVTLDLDFSNILAYPPANFTGIVVLRLADQAHMTVRIPRRSPPLSSPTSHGVFSGAMPSIACAGIEGFRGFVMKLAAIACYFWLRHLPLRA